MNSYIYLRNIVEPRRESWRKAAVADAGSSFQAKKYDNDPALKRSANMQFIFQLFAFRAPAASPKMILTIQIK